MGCHRLRPASGCLSCRSSSHERARALAHPLDSLINEILGEAQKRGELDNLPGAGKPLELEGTPQNAVLGRLAKEANVMPPVVVLKQKIAESKARLAALAGEEERKAEMKVLADLEMRLALEIEAFRRFG